MTIIKEFFVVVVLNFADTRSQQLIELFWVVLLLAFFFGYMRSTYT